MSDSLQLHGPATRLLCPWNVPGKNTGTGCHFLPWGIFLIQELNLCLLSHLHGGQILYHYTTWEAHGRLAIHSICTFFGCLFEQINCKANLDYQEYFNTRFRLTLWNHGGEGNGNPLQCSCLENPVDRGAWWAAVHGVTQSRTRLKRLSNSSMESWVIFAVMLMVSR